MRDTLKRLLSAVLVIALVFAIAPPSSWIQASAASGNESTAITVIGTDGKEDIFIYWQITRGTGIRQHQFPEAGTKPNLWIFMKPGKPADSGKRLKLTDMEDTRFLHCNIKTLNLLVNVMAAEKAESLGCGECVFHRGDIVTECAHSNVSIIKDGVFKTHPTDHYILPGITRMHILTHAGKISAKLAKEKADQEYDKFKERTKNNLSPVEIHFLENFEREQKRLMGGKDKNK
mgnify:CR=1 FL=1